MVVGGGIITVVTLMVCSGDGSAGYFDGELGTRCRTGTAAVAAWVAGWGVVIPHLAQQVLEGIRMVVHIIIHHVGQTHGLCCCWCKLTRIHRWSLGISSNGVFRDVDLTWLEQDRLGRTTHCREGVMRGEGGNGKHLRLPTFTTSTDIHGRGYTLLLPSHRHHFVRVGWQFSQTLYRMEMHSYWMDFITFITLTFFLN